SCGMRAGRIIQNMLQFSRKSDGGYELTDMVDLVDRTVELAANDYDLKKKFDFRHIRIERDYAENLPPVPARQTELEQVVLNILKNAAQAMQGMEDTSHVATIRLALRREGPMVKLVIADNGPGMAETTRRRIFEPFFTTKDIGEGTGLGLSVSYFIITNNHGGRIEVRSTPGDGAAFEISLPVERGADDTPADC
ncbi:MAG: sensor histidine kinase, partial [Planctomycetota bacterium]